MTQDVTEHTDTLFLLFSPFLFHDRESFELSLTKYTVFQSNPSMKPSHDILKLLSWTPLWQHTMAIVVLHISRQNALDMHYKMQTKLCNWTRHTSRWDDQVNRSTVIMLWSAICVCQGKMRFVRGLYFGVTFSGVLQKSISEYGTWQVQISSERLWVGKYYKSLSYITFIHVWIYLEAK